MNIIILTIGILAFIFVLGWSVKVFAHNAQLLNQQNKWREHIADLENENNFYRRENHKLLKMIQGENKEQEAERKKKTVCKLEPKKK